MLVVGFVALFSVGCGNSRDAFVQTNTQGNTGNLVFNFTRPQTTTSVPTNTVSFRFDLFSTNPGTQATLVESRGPVAYQDQIVLAGVPTNVVFVTVTALNSDGVALAIFTGSTDVLLNADNVVNLDGSQTVTFDALTVTPAEVYLLEGGEQQLTFTGAFTPGGNIPLTINDTVADFTGFVPFANITSTGVVSLASATLGQNVTVTGSYTILSTTRTDDFVVGFIAFDAFATNTTFTTTGTFDPGYSVMFTDSDGTAPIDVTGNTTFALSTPTTGVSVNSTSGAVTIDGTATVPTSFDVVCTWNDGRTGGTGVTVQDTIDMIYNRGDRKSVV